MKNDNFIKVSKSNVEARLDVFIYENDGFKIAYAPSLDIMGYGKTVDDAKQSFEVVIEDFFLTTIKENTLNAYLQEHGWTKEARRVKYSFPLSMDLLETNKQVQDIFANDFEKETLPLFYAIA